MLLGRLLGLASKTELGKKLYWTDVQMGEMIKLSSNFSIIKRFYTISHPTFGVGSFTSQVTNTTGMKSTGGTSMSIASQYCLKLGISLGTWLIQLREDFNLLVGSRIGSILGRGLLVTSGARGY